MRVDYSSKVNQYYQNLTSSKKENIDIPDKNQKEAADTVEFSKESLKKLEDDNSVKKNYDLAKIMEIHEKGFHQIPTKEESDYYWKARREDPELDAQLYAQDKADALNVVNKVQNILMKALSGQPLTPEEEKMVKEDPALSQEVEMRKTQAKMWKN